MTTAAATPAATEALIAEYVALAVESHNAPTIAESHDAERRAREFARRFQLNEFDLEPRVLEAVFASMTDDELRVATNDPSRRVGARAELRRRAEVADAAPAETDDPCTCDVTIVGEDGDHLAGCVSSNVADRESDPADLDDHRLWVQFMIEDRALGGYDDDPNTPDDERHGAIIGEIVRRFGMQATENTAEYAVALHMSGDDLVRWARDQFEHLIGIATGRIVPEWERGDGFEVTGRTHGTGCTECDQQTESAVVTASATGSVGCTSSSGEHSATVRRAAR